MNLIHNYSIQKKVESVSEKQAPYEIEKMSKLPAEKEEKTRVVVEPQTDKIYDFDNDKYCPMLVVI